ncbi:hypothetical protein IAT40_001944 [Kwoniella sp. CBS 6097]
MTSHSHSSCHSGHQTMSRPSHSPASHDDPFPSPGPIAITDNRQRSNTVLTTSSTGSSLPYPQTPQTPAIAGVSNAHQCVSPGALSASPTESLTLGRRRKDSYGFGDALRAASPPLSPSYSYWTRLEPIRPTTDDQTPSTSSSSAGPSQAAVAGPSTHATLRSVIGNSVPAPDLASLIQRNIQVSTPPTHADSAHIYLNGTSHTHSAPNEGAAPATITVRSVTSSPVPSANNDGNGYITPSDKSRSTLKAAVRRKLERSRTSFRVLNRPPVAVTGSSTHTTGDVHSNGAHLPLDSIATESARRFSQGKRTARLRGLFAVSRNNSSTAIRSVANINSNQAGASNSYTTSAHSDPAPPTVTLQGVSPSLDGLHYLYAPEHSTTHGQHYPRHARHLSVDGSGDQALNPDRDEGAGAARHPWLIGITPIKDPSDGDGLDPASVPHRIRRHRALSMPLPDTHELDLLTMLQTDAEVIEAPRDFFDTMLPRELKLLILRTLLRSHEEDTGNGRFCGEINGRKELIRFSRLWPLIQLEPISHLLHPSTFERILTSALPCIRELHLRGMDSLVGATLLTALTTQDRPMYKPWELVTRSMWMPNLRLLDLRHCDSLTSTEIAFIVSNAPSLRSINLKGVQAVTSEVIRAIAKSCRTLQHLDVSRCWEITLGDMVTLIRSMDDHQAGALVALHLGGIKSIGRYAGDFLPLVAERLVNLVTLDLQGCTHIYSGDFERHGKVLDSLGRTSSITHLNLSGCAALTKDVFKHLEGRFPNLTKFELADLPYLFDGERDDEDAGLVRFLRTTPTIQKLDLERTGERGGVTDRVLDLLSYGRALNGERVGQMLVELKISDAKDVTPQAMARVIKWCKNLTRIEADNTAANRNVAHELQLQSDTRLEALTASLLDCPGITREAHEGRRPSYLVRHGWTGWPAVPFEYDADEIANTVIAHHIKANVDVSANMRLKLPVIKSTWLWKNTKTTRDWREARDQAQIRHDRLAAASSGDCEVSDEGELSGGGDRTSRLGRRRGSGATGLALGVYGNSSGSCTIM